MKEYAALNREYIMFHKYTIRCILHGRIKMEKVIIYKYKHRKI